jgi:hypothetical protein
MGILRRIPYLASLYDSLAFNARDGNGFMGNGYCSKQFDID